MAILIKADGEIREVSPADKKRFTLEEMQAFVGGTIDMKSVPPRASRTLVLNDDGKNVGLPYNHAASALWRWAYPIEAFPHNNDETVVGDVLLLDEAETRSGEVE